MLRGRHMHLTGRPTMQGPVTGHSRRETASNAIGDLIHSGDLSPERLPPIFSSLLGRRAV